MALGDSRRASGAAMVDSRRAIDKAMIERRTGKSVVEDINALAAPPRQKRSLPRIEPVGSLPARRGSGVYSPPPSTSAGGGIAGPLLEKTKVVEGVTLPDREYWPSGLLSSDGLFVLPSIKTLNLIDANDEEVQIQLAAQAGV